MSLEFGRMPTDEEEVPFLPADVEWVDCQEPGLRVAPAAGVRTPDDGLLAIAEDHACFRYLVRVAPGHGNVGWVALRTDRMRDLTVLSGVMDVGTGRPDVADLIGRALRTRHESDVRGASVGPAFLALTGRWEGEPRRLYDRFAALCGRATMPLVAVGEPLDWVRSLDRLAGVEAVDTALCRLPLMIPVLRTLSYGLRDESIRALTLPLLDPDTRLDGMVDAIRAADLKGRIPASRDGDLALRRLMVRLEGVWMPGTIADSVMCLAPYVPAAWMPSDVLEVHRMVSVTGKAVALSRKSRATLSVGKLLAPVRGDWKRMHAALATAGGDVTPGQFASDVRDMVSAFDRQVLLPAQGNAAVRRGEALPVVGRSRDLAPAWRALFAGKGLQSVAETLSDWHRRSAAMTGTIESLSPLGPRSWSRSYVDIVAINGLSVVEIRTFDGLCREGKALSHCVATYAEGCAAGEFAILSVRAADGTPRSTAQIGPGGDVVQHRGCLNAEPDPSDAAALAEALLSARGGIGQAGVVRRATEAVRNALTLHRRWRARAWHPQYPYDPSDLTKVDAAGRLWERYLPRSLRGGAERLVTGVAAIPPLTPPAAPVPGEPGRRG